VRSLVPRAAFDAHIDGYPRGGCDGVATDVLISMLSAQYGSYGTFQAVPAPAPSRVDRICESAKESRIFQGAANLNLKEKCKGLGARLRRNKSQTISEPEAPQMNENEVQVQAETASPEPPKAKKLKEGTALKSAVH